ncbi:MAG TPA: DNA polymerase ligase N-terminal domain-containing protein [Gemmataceae bacterium]
MPRYVILAHDWPAPHWDLMLESGGALRTWRLETPPRPGAEVAAEESFAHRPAYLDYEGPVSGGRGTVRRWDVGEFDWERDAAGQVTVRVRGRELSGRLELAAEGAGRWRVRYREEGPGSGVE